MATKDKKFYKEEFLKSDVYKKRKDLINMLLVDGEMYSKNEVEKILKKYLEGVI